MGLVSTILVNAWRLLRNAFVRFRSPPDYVTLEIHGSLPELEPRRGFLRRRLSPGPLPPSLEGLRERLSRVAADGRGSGVVLHIRDLDAGWAALEELGGELSRFRERGGRVTAYLIGANSRAYYLACAADEILATPLATVSPLGVRTRINFLKDALARAGLSAEVLAVSPYKSGADPLVRRELSEEAREQAERLVGNRLSVLVDAIAGGRGISREEAERKIDYAPYTAPAALEEGLLDGTCYEDQLPERLGGEGEPVKVAGWETAAKALRRPYRASPRRRVGVVSLSGTIVRGKSRKAPLPIPLIGGEQAGSDTVTGALRAAERNKKIAAVLFHVDSRGGDGLASDLIWREVQRISHKKPVVVLMGEAAASGGYYVSAPASHVVARRGTLTGSIGVFIVRPIAADLYERLGVNPVAVGRGDRAGILDASRKPTADELGVLEDQLRHSYEEFKRRVSHGRGMEMEPLEEISGGQVWTGEEARERGLVDEVGGFREAFEKAREMAGIETEAPEVLVRVSPPRTSPPPGDTAEAAREMMEAVAELGESRLWAALSYEISED